MRDEAAHEWGTTTAKMLARKKKSVQGIPARIGGVSSKFVCGQTASGLPIGLLLPGEADLEGGRDAPSGKQRQRIAGRGSKRGSRRRRIHAGDSLRVEKVVEAQAQLRLSKVTDLMHVVVEEEIGESE